MRQPLLSILIPATPDRIDGMSELMNRLKRPRMMDGMRDAVRSHGDDWIADDNYIEANGDHVEIIVYCDNKTLSLGQKRERLYKKAKGIYSLQVDSDDLVSENARQLIIEAIKNNPEVDCITFRESVTINGVYSKSNFSLQYDDWTGDGTSDLGDGFSYWRTPFYKCVIKTEIARSVPFEHIRYAEDHAWARALKPHLKTEVHIGEEIYLYIHNSKPEEHNERYGIQ